MILTFDELKELITFAILGLAFVLMYKSVPSGFVDKFREAAGKAAEKTPTPLDDTLLSLLDNVRLLLASNEQLKAASDKTVQDPVMWKLPDNATITPINLSTEIAPQEMAQSQEERPRD